MAEGVEPIFCGEIDALEIDVEKLVPLRQAGFVQRLGRPNDPGIVVDGVEAPVFFQRLGDRGLHLISLGHVAHNTQMLSSQFCHGGLDTIGGAGGDRDDGPLGRVGLGTLSPDSLRAAGKKNNLASKRHK